MKRALAANEKMKTMDCVERHVQGILKTDKRRIEEYLEDESKQCGAARSLDAFSTAVLSKPRSLMPGVLLCSPRIYLEYILLTLCSRILQWFWNRECSLPASEFSRTVYSYERSQF